MDEQTEKRTNMWRENRLTESVPPSFVGAAEACVAAARDLPAGMLTWQPEAPQKYQSEPGRGISHDVMMMWTQVTRSGLLCAIGTIKEICILISG